jgi:hypothetical protein
MYYYSLYTDNFPWKTSALMELTRACICQNCTKEILYSVTWNWNASLYLIRDAWSQNTSLVYQLQWSISLGCTYQWLISTKWVTRVQKVAATKPSIGASLTRFRGPKNKMNSSYPTTLGPPGLMSAPPLPHPHPHSAPPFLLSPTSSHVWTQA